MVASLHILCLAHGNGDEKCSNYENDACRHPTPYKYPRYVPSLGSLRGAGTDQLLPREKRGLLHHMENHLSRKSWPAWPLHPQCCVPSVAGSPHRKEGLRMDLALAPADCGRALVGRDAELQSETEEREVTA